MHLVLRGIVRRHGNVLLLRRIDRVRLDRLQRRTAAREIQSLITVNLDHMALACKIKY